MMGRGPSFGIPTTDSPRIPPLNAEPTAGLIRFAGSALSYPETSAERPDRDISTRFRAAFATFRRILASNPALRPVLKSP